MEIRDIKAGLNIMTVLHHYGLKPDKHDMLVCPFHEDKSPRSPEDVQMFGLGCA